MSSQHSLLGGPLDLNVDLGFKLVHPLAGQVKAELVLTRVNESHLRKNKKISFKQLFPLMTMAVTLVPQRAARSTGLEVSSRSVSTMSCSWARLSGGNWRWKRSP